MTGILPGARDPAPECASQERAALPAAPARGKVVLIVDVDGRAGPLLVRPLGEAGFQAHVLRQAGAALEMIERSAPEVVIVGGPVDPDLYRTLRRAVAAPLLALAPRADDEQILDAFAAGVDQFQIGPIGSAEVVARVAALLRRAA